MKQGFIYRFDRCVACQSCVAGCSLENKGNIPWRAIITSNPYSNPGLPVHNLSLACNHCENPSCLQACPANAYKKDPETGAVILNEKRCIGCNYCYWNCPFDAPQYNNKSHQVEKCNFCYERLIEGIEPACTSACPTGALSYGEIREGDSACDNIPEMGLFPRLNYIMPRKEKTIPEIIPEPQNNTGYGHSGSKFSKVSARSEWNLIVFSFLSSLLVAFSFSEWKGTIDPGFGVYLLILIIAFLASLTHLGKPLKAWRSLANIKNSVLSMEVAAFIIFSIVSLPAILFSSQVLWIPSFISGLILLFAIDNVYSYSDTRISFHSGQVFLTGLLFSSYLINEEMAFVFIIFVKIISVLYYKIIKDRYKLDKLYGIIYILVSLFVTAGFFINSGSSLVLFGVLLVSELSIRIIYYRDLDPISVMRKYKNI